MYGRTRERPRRLGVFEDIDAASQQSDERFPPVTYDQVRGLIAGKGTVTPCIRPQKIKPSQIVGRHCDPPVQCDSGNISSASRHRDERRRGPHLLHEG